MYTRTGIELAQQGRRHEALPYLRYAVTVEPVSADSWLWLAHVTPDIQEYRHSVYQALALNPSHPTALRMQADLDYQRQGMSPPVTASPVLQQMETRSKREKRWRRWLIFLVILALAVLASLALREGANRVDTDEFLSRLTETEAEKQISFAVGSETEALAFEVTVPETWILADKGSPSWREKRDELEQTFSTSAGFWRDLETDLGEVVYNPDGTLSEWVVVVETDPTKINLPNAPRLEFIETRVLPEAENACAALAEFAKTEQAQVSQRPGFEAAEVQTRGEDDCIYFVHIHPTDVHRYEILVPLEDNRAAVWQIHIQSDVFSDYEKAIKTILDTLRHA